MVDRRLWNDGHGIDRVELPSTEGLVAVRADDLLALENVVVELRDIVASCSPGGVHWDDPAKRAEFFARADDVWEKCIAIVRGDDPMIETNGQERPV